LEIRLLADHRDDLVAGAEGFETDAQFARQAGVAPIPASSGLRTRHRLHRGGDRQLNRAIHVIAITRARTDPESCEYVRRRMEDDGKTKREASRCLKRQLARRIHKLLMTPPNPQPQTNRIRINAPIQAACLT
jgi:transposase